VPFPQDPLAVRVDLLLATAPVDITSDVYVRDGIQITRGRSAEATQADPTECQLTLNNRTGRYSPRNPASDLYGLLKRNTPIRVATRPDSPALSRVRDSFTRTVSGGWGTPSEDGPAWVVFSPSSDFSVSGGRGRITITGAGAQVRLCNPSGSQCADAEVAFSFAAPLATGDQLEIGCELGAFPVPPGGGSSQVQARAELRPGGAVGLRVAYDDPSSPATETAVTVAGLTHTGAAQLLRLRAKVMGERVYARVWDTTGAEPTTWQLVVTLPDRVEPRRGRLLLRAVKTAGNTNTTPVIEFDDVEIDPESPRFVGEVTAWPPRTDVSVRDLHVPAEASGVLRRLGQGQDPLVSPLRRVLGTPESAAALDVVGYWPLEDGGENMGVGSTFGSPLGYPPMEVVAGATRGRRDGWAGSAPGPVMGTATLEARVPLSPPGVGEATVWTHVDIPDSGWGVSEITLIRWSMTGTAPVWRLVVNNAGALRVQVEDGDGNVLHNPTYGFAGQLDRGRWLIGVELRQVGADIDVVAAVYEEGAAVGFILADQTVTGRTFGRFRSVTQGSASTPDLSVVHVALFDRVRSIFDAAAQFNGFALGGRWETADARFVRLATEEDVPVVVTARRSSQRMGVQPRGELLDLLDDTAQVGGAVVEDQVTGRLRWLGREDLYAAEAAPTLALTWGVDVAPPLEPSDDDQRVRNDVTVTRRGGAQATVEITTGAFSTAKPPAGIGRYRDSADLTLLRDEQAEQHAAWRVHEGTWDELRVPAVSVDLAASPGRIDAVDATEVGSVLTVTGTPAWLALGGLRQVVEGWTETLSAYEWRVTFATSPADLWRASTLDDTADNSARSRADTAGSTIASAVTDTATSLSVATSLGPVWTQAAGDLPMDLVLGGVERVRVTAVTGSTSPQTMTVTRGVDGYARAHAAGADVRLWRPGRAVL
jgi:hypothetical protein